MCFSNNFNLATTAAALIEIMREVSAKLGKGWVKLCKDL